ncbi:MAG: hypothetical protein E7317_10625 [Clostridiales bacterium]|nr:hypothetical protein [Clostridiales bacterium]
MRSDVITISSRGSHMDAALSQAEKVAVYKELSHADALHLRLLAEEMMSMMRAIAGRVDGSFWIEDADGVFELHLKVRTDMDADQRATLLSASTTGINEATRGFMGKIRAFFEPAQGVPLFFDVSSPDAPRGMHTNAVWSMGVYREELRRSMQQKREGAAEAWDELEKSVVAHVADDVRVSIMGRDVELVILKKLG